MTPPQGQHPSPRLENDRGLTTELKAVVIAIHVVVTIATIFGNTLVIRAFYKFSSLRNASNIILVSLSVVDLLMVVAFILHIANILVGGKLPPHTLCGAGSTINLTLNGTIILHLALISVERFIAVKFALRYHAIVTNRRAVIASTVVWLWGIAAVIVFPEAFKAAGRETFTYYMQGLTPCFDRRRSQTVQSESVRAYLFFLVVSLLVVPILIITASYGYIVKVACKQRRQIHEDNQGNLAVLKCEMKGACTVAIVVGICLVSFVPLVVVLCLKFLSSASIGPHQMYPVYTVASLNACWNPVIYCWRNENFRNSFKRLLKCKS